MAGRNTHSYERTGKEKERNESYDAHRSTVFKQVFGYILGGILAFETDGI